MLPNRYADCELISSFITGKVRAFFDQFCYPLVTHKHNIVRLLSHYCNQTTSLNRTCFYAAINSASWAQNSFKCRFSPSFAFQSSARIMISPRGPFGVFFQPRYELLIFIIISYICYLCVYLFSDFLIWCGKEYYVSSIWERKRAFSGFWRKSRTNDSELVE